MAKSSNIFHEISNALHCLFLLSGVIIMIAKECAGTADAAKE